MSTNPRKRRTSYRERQEQRAKQAQEQAQEQSRQFTACGEYEIVPNPYAPGSFTTVPTQR